MLPPEQEAIRDTCFHPSGTFGAFPEADVETSIPERFEKIVGLYPDRVAIQTEEGVATYAELNAMANRFARLLVKTGGSQPEPVGLYFDKGIALGAAMLGVLKAGKFFLFLDPSFPLDRIAAVLDNSQARLILAHYKNPALESLAARRGLRWMGANSIASEPAASNLRFPLSSTSLAYLIYTSGSTGAPKGVAKTHQNQLHAIMLRTNANHICVRDRIALLPAGTANAVTNSFMALLNGAALLPFDVQKKGVHELANWLSAQRISICQIASPLFRRLCEVLTGREDFSSLRILRMRSESVRISDFALYQKHFPPPCLFLNGLSTSETGVITEFLANHETRVAGSEIPVGYAMQGMEVLLLDDKGEEVGDDQIGEMAIRSKYLSPGYWNDPERTRAKFKPDPTVPAMRLYYTGDLAKRLPDGCLLYKGRKDFRVKIRGYGVELGEIDKALKEHPKIKESIALAPPDDAGEARLMCYFVCDGKPAPTVSELRRYLKAKLPDYMIPASFVRLDALPLTPNGKVNRALLPKPDSSRPELDVPFTVPRTPLEQKLAGIFANVLSLDRLGVHDNFFDLGGHSLAATRVASQIKRQMEATIPVEALFRFPTVASLAEHVEQIARPDGGSVDSHIPAFPRNAPLPLSFSQQRLWFLSQLDPGGYGYNLCAAYRLKGDLNVPALEQSVNEIIKRHEVLRTVFMSVDGTPEQVILPFLPLKIRTLDVSGVGSVEEREAEIRDLARLEAQRPFDLTSGPMLRITLLRLARREWLLLRSMHHIVTDGWSSGIFFGELAEIYDGFLNERPTSCPDLPIQYADFAAWQRQRFQGEFLDSHLSYWRRVLENLSTLELPVDRPRPVLQTFRGSHQFFRLPQTLSEQLKKLSQRNGVTLFMTLLSAFQILLSKYSGQTDIVTGSPVAGRNHGEIELLIGFFLNMLALRLDLSDDPKFCDVLIRTKRMCLEALDHQDLPFEKLVEELQPKRDLSHSALFQVTFGFRNTPQVSLQLAGIEAEEVEIESGIAKFDINLFMEEKEDQLRGYVNYNTDLFDGETIQRLTHHFQNLLEEIVADPEQRVSNLRLLSEQEKRQLLVAWNQTRCKDSADPCLHGLFEAQVAKTPDAVAVVFEDRQLSYRELNQKANQMANYLRERGVGTESIVGINLNRSIEMVVSLLGVLKSGAAYLPLDPEHPADRLSFILQDAHVSVLLTERELKGQLSEQRLPIVCVDEDWKDVAIHNESNPGSTTTADNLAYVIYTSGSTGTPKGVMIGHRSVVNCMKSMQKSPGITHQDAVLALTTLSFDIAALELLLPLTVGARTVLLRREVAMDGFRLSEQLSRNGITVAQATPSGWQMLLNSEWHGSSGLKILSGGETLTKGLAESLLAKGSSLWNFYGPTETTIWSTCCRVPDVGADVTLGRPMDNTEIYILDAYLEPVPIGVRGELYIGGCGLARGYLNRPDLTAERFIPHPFSAEPGARLYRTGDLARYRPDGNIEFHGRIDQQVKIRGFRIEPGEIESILSLHADVRDCLVVAPEDERGAKRLVAYLVSDPESSPTVDELKNLLGKKLPGYMVPSDFVFLDAVPRFVNGKVDRRKLPALGQNRPENGTAFVPPRSPTERSLAEIWSRTLKLSKVGIHENFFDLGGHSLIATQVITRIREALQIGLPVSALFEKPTIAQLALWITEMCTERVGAAVASQLLEELDSGSDESILDTPDSDK